MTIGAFDQTSEEWRAMHRGMLTSSEWGRILKASPKTLDKIRLEKQAELQGAVLPSFTAQSTDWGKQTEPQARAQVELYLIELGILPDTEEIIVPGLIIHDDYIWAGSSPDGLILSIKMGGELKCPFDQSIHMKHFDDHTGDFKWRQNIPEKYYAQVQGGMWVTGWDLWFYASFDPRLLETDPDHALFLTLVKRDEMYIKNMVRRLVWFWGTISACKR